MATRLATCACLSRRVLTLCSSHAPRTTKATHTPSPSRRPQLQYPATARGDVVDDYHGVKVADPYRWFEDPNAQATRDWVTAENALAQPYLERLPQRAWLGNRLKQLWTYERFGVPQREGGKYFFMRNDGKQDQSVLYVADALKRRRACWWIPMASARTRPSRCRSGCRAPTARWWRMRSPMAAPTGTSGISVASTTAPICRHAQVQQVLARLLGARQLRRVLQPLSAEARGHAEKAERGDDAGRPDVYFHKLDEAQAADKLVYQVTDHPTRVPAAQVTEDGRYLVIALFDGYEANGVLIQDLRKPGAKPRPLFTAWDALYNFIGSKGDELYFQTTNAAPRGRVIAVNANKPEPAAWRTVVPQARMPSTRRDNGGRIVVDYTRDAASLVKLFETSGTAPAKSNYPASARPRISRAAATIPRPFSRTRISSRRRASCGSMSRRIR